MKKILLTGATGFIGRRLIDLIPVENLVILGRSKPISQKPLNFFQSNIDDVSNYMKALHNVDVVVHSAAKVHVMNQKMSDSLFEFRRVNTSGTLNLAQQAAEAGVKRFLFISTVKVSGESTTGLAPLVENDISIAGDAYSISKYEAEQGLLSLAKKTSMEVVIIRPPLVYGPGVKGNFSTMVSLIKKKVPLPLGCVTNNKRSLLALDNLVDFILFCADRDKTPQAANQAFLVADGEGVSTVELLKRIANAYHKKLYMLPIPNSLLSFVAKILGKKKVADRLLGDLQVDDSKAIELLGWKPIISMNEQLSKMAESDS